MTEDEFEELVELWHEGAAGQGQELHEFLGMTLEQYSAWLHGTPRDTSPLVHDIHVRGPHTSRPGTVFADEVTCPYCKDWRQRIYPLIEITIRTRIPGKWRFVDTETREVWAWESGHFVRSEL